ncbi:integrase core domain-containing protein [Actinomyces qiguomingii]|uniref:integrase core domain-containing protein n=1 Tax=Actinomyces qiguomingii TaxID=2057800 RepID=UPI00143D46D3|nr:integrase core domain-containing protein [Actinomyces qiguomingii]
MVFGRRWGVRGCAGTSVWAESMGATLKNERVHRMVYPTRDKAIRDVASWIELTYNQTRLHSGIGYRTPNQFERELQQAATPKAA